MMLWGLSGGVLCQSMDSVSAEQVGEEESSSPIRAAGWQGRLKVSASMAVAILLGDYEQEVENDCVAELEFVQILLAERTKWEKHK
jgi:hypothetical protein